MGAKLKNEIRQWLIIIVPLLGGALTGELWDINAKLASIEVQVAALHEDSSMNNKRIERLEDKEISNDRKVAQITH